MPTTTANVPIGDLVAELRRCNTASFEHIGEIRELLRRAPVAPETLTPYLMWDGQHYTRNLIDKTPLYELIAICWEVGQCSSIHNHKDQNCWMAVPIGRLLVQNYRVLQQDLSAGSCHIVPSDVVEMDPRNPCAVDPNEPVHKVYNPAEFAARAVSLHVYSRPFDSCVVYSEEQGKCGEIKLHYNSEYGNLSRR
ncbi:MAG TPA: cysteine dioxygenase family protein [Terriglobales bacterium]|nr:cysteine dioxygenase family protein [Terriglobales bacterium]